MEDQVCRYCGGTLKSGEKHPICDEHLRRTGKADDQEFRKALLDILVEIRNEINNLADQVNLVASEAERIGDKLGKQD